jgi:phage-related baseplate assembly protein
MSREWYRPNPDPGNVKWNSRSNVNMQESALLITLHTVAGEKEKFLDTYYSKMKHQIELGKTEAPYAYVIPAKQRKRADVAALVNVVLREGAEIQQASSAFKVGNLQVEPGDYIVRMDQPYRGIVEMYLGVQWYPPENPRPYDDTGWSIPLLHNIRTVRVDDKSILDQPMTIVKGPASFAGSITGAGSTIVVDNTTDNALMTWRIQNTGTKMSAAEQAFDLDGHHFAAGAFVVQNADRAALEPSI